MLISLGNLDFFDLENIYLLTEKMKNNRYTKNHIQKLHDKKVQILSQR